VRTYLPHASEFVVSARRVSELATLAEVLPSNMRVEPLPGDRHRRLLRMVVGAVHPSENWAALRRYLGAGYRVLPVLTDTSGREVYPTGRVQVRFRERMSKAQLLAFARRHGLKLLRTNEFQPAQAAFEPQSEDVFLMDVVAEAGCDERVRVAWPETKAEFSKV
jgi:hypothetical protein